MSTGTQGRTRIIVVGASGRMGARICALAHADSAFALIGALERAGSAGGGQAAADDECPGPAPKIAASVADYPRSCADVVIDFSSDAGARDALELARRIGAALLVG